MSRHALVTIAFALVVSTGCTHQIISPAPAARQQGIELYAQQNYGEAAGAFRNAVREDPRDYKSLYYLGCCYTKQNQFHQAVESFKSSLDAQTRTLEGRENEAARLRTMDALAALIARTDSRDAETNAVEQHARDTQSSESYFLLAKIYRYRGDAESALDAYNRAVLKNPKDFSLVKEYGLYQEQLGLAKPAEITLRKAYVMKGTDDDVAAALRRLSVVPGPAIKERDELVQPPIPKGPIPPINEMNPFGGNKSASNEITPQPSGAAPAAPAPVPPQTVQAPND